MNPALLHIHNTLLAIRSEITKEIFGQDPLIEKLLITVFSGGHALLEGVPGLGKTKTIRTLATVLDLPTKRISFTPDLLPSDLTGAEIYRPGKKDFEVRKGPIFTSILLADEINRTPPKVQSALLEAMEEKKVTIGEETFILPTPFVVFATQNPLEHEGTYPLPEAQLDRFLMRIVLTYPHKNDEKHIFITATQGASQPSSWKEWEQDTPPFQKPSAQDIMEMIDYIARNIRIDPKLYDYVSDLLTTYRGLTLPNSQYPYIPLVYGPSTRAGIALLRCARVLALLWGRDYVMPEDIKSLAHDVIDHRIGLSYDALTEGIKKYDITESVLDTVKIG